MNLNQLIITLTIPTLVIITPLYSCNTEPELPPAPCSENKDCKNERKCIDKTCVYPQDYSLKKSNVQLYFWSVGSCSGGGTVEKEVEYQQKHSTKLTRTFSKEKVGNAQCLDSYLCALQKNPNLYVVEGQYQNVYLKGNLLLETSEPFPGKEVCKNTEWNKPWYKDCFINGSACPKP